MYENAKVRGHAEVFDAKVYGNAIIAQHAVIEHGSAVYGGAKVYGNAEIYNAHIYGYAEVYGNAQVWGDAHIRGHVRICGDTTFDIAISLKGDAIIKRDSDYIVFKNHWSSRRHFIYTKSNKKWIVGCFYGTGEELIKRAYADGAWKGQMYEKYVRMVEASSNLKAL